MNLDLVNTLQNRANLPMEIILQGLHQTLGIREPIHLIQVCQADWDAFFTKYVIPAVSKSHLMALVQWIDEQTMQQQQQQQEDVEDGTPIDLSQFSVSIRDAMAADLARKSRGGGCTTTSTTPTPPLHSKQQIPKTKRVPRSSTQTKNTTKDTTVSRFHTNRTRQKKSPQKPLPPPPLPAATTSIRTTRSTTTEWRTNNKKLLISLGVVVLFLVVAVVVVVVVLVQGGDAGDNNSFLPPGTSFDNAMAARIWTRDRTMTI
uniref:Uncharacterized protein n=1 Tax=Amphora coffeiformis TaxID=265554 RepID=A0A6S8JGL9_9STRA